MTSVPTGLPHLREFTEANPHLTQHQCIGLKLTGDERYQMWRNCDRNIRNWWRINRDSVKTSHVVFMEWDVLCNVPLEHLLQPAEGLLCAEVKTYPEDCESWYWFKGEFPKLPPDMQPTACAAVPLAVLQFSRNALDLICDKRFDGLYEKDLYCELRTSSLLSSEGFPVIACESLKNVDWRPQPYPWRHRGIFHPVKKSRYFGCLTQLIRRWVGQE